MVEGRYNDFKQKQKKIYIAIKVLLKEKGEFVNIGHYHHTRTLERDIQQGWAKYIDRGRCGPDRTSGKYDVKRRT